MKESAATPISLSTPGVLGHSLLDVLFKYACVARAPYRYVRPARRSDLGVSLDPFMNLPG